MVNRKQEKEQEKRPAKVDVEGEKQTPGWVQKYLDLADLLTKRRKDKHDRNRPKAA